MSKNTTPIDTNNAVEGFLDTIIILPCPFCGSHNFTTNIQYIADVKVNTIKCKSCSANAPMLAWQKRQFLKDHEIAILTNEITKTCKKYCNTQSLRNIISQIITKKFK